MLVLSRILFVFTLMLSVSTPAWSMDNIHHDQESIDAVYNIKNTYRVVSDEYKQLSWLNGALAGDVIRRLYDFGEIKPVWSKDKRGRSIITGYEQGGHALVRLVHAFFYRIPGSTSSTDFGETKQLVTNLSDHDIMNLIADMLVCSIHARHALATIHKELPAFIELDVQNQFFMLCDNNKRETAIKNEVWRRIGTKNDQDRFKLLRKEVRTAIKDAIEKLWENIEHITKKIEALLNPVARKSLNGFSKYDKRGEVFLRSLLESNPGSTLALYLPHMTETVLLAFVYRKCGQEKEKITYFYKILHEKLDQKFLKEDFVSDSYHEMSSEAAVNRLNKIFKKKDLAQYGEEILFCSTQRRGYPTPNNYKKLFGYEIGGIVTVVHDCMENAMRNVIRSIAYDRTLNEFKITLLQHKGKTNIHESLKDYVNKYNNPKGDCSDQAHLEWLQLVSNIPYLFYCRTVRENKSVSANKNGLYAYLMVPQEEKIDEQWLAANKIEIIHNYGFEVQPCLRNIIILLNHLLQLGLFDNKKIVDEIVRPDFIKIYFPLLCEKLGCEGFLATDREKNEHEQDKDFDAIDFVNNIYATFIFPGFSSCFRTYPGHGELTMTEGDNEGVVDLSKRSIGDKYPLLSLFITHLRNSSKALDLLVPHHVYSNMFALSLEDNNQTRNLFQTLCNFSGLSHVVKKELVKLLQRVIVQQPDEQERMRLTLQLFQWALDAELSSFYGKAAQAARKAIQSKNKSIYKAGLNVFTSLVNKHCKHIVTEAFNAGVVAINNNFVVSNFISQRSLVSLFKALLDQNHECAQITHIAGEAITSQDNSMRSLGEDLFDILFEKNYEPAFIEAIKQASEMILSDNWNIHYSGENLFKKLFEVSYQLAFTVAIKIATGAEGSEDKEISRRRIYLLETLFEKNQGSAEALNAAIEVLTSKNKWNPFFGLSLFEALFKKDLAFTEALNIAQELVKSEDQEVYQVGLDLFIKLVRNNHAYVEAGNAAQVAIGNHDLKICVLGIELCTELVNKGEMLTEATHVAREQTQSTNQEIYLGAIKLLFALVQQNEAYGEAIVVAQEAMKSLDSKKISIGFKLFTMLIGKNQGCIEASQCAEQFFQDTKFQWDAGALFLNLFEKDQGFTQAAQALILAFKTEVLQDHAFRLLKKLVEFKTDLPEIGQALKEMFHNKNFRKRVIEFFAQLFEKGYGFTQAAKLAVSAFKTEALQYDVLQLLKKLVEFKPELPEIAELAFQAFQDRNLEYGAMEIFKKLLEKGHGFTQAVQAAAQAFGNEALLYSTNLFKKLFEKGYGFTQAAQVAAQTFHNKELRWKAERLFEKLFDKGYGFVEAVQAAAQAFQNKDLQWGAESLFKKLFERGHGFTEAIQAAVQALGNKDLSEWQAHELIKKVFSHGRGCDEVFKIADEAMKSDNQERWRVGLMLFQLLSENGTSYEEGVSAACKAMKSDNGDVQTYGRALFKELFTHNKGFQEAFEATLEMIKSENLMIRCSSFTLLGFLVQCDKYLEEALGAAFEAVKSENPDIKSAGLDLFRELCIKGYELEKIVHVIAEAIKSDNKKIKKSALRVLIVLVEKEKAFEEATDAACEAVKSGHKSIKGLGLELFAALLKQGKMFDEALKVAQEFFPYKAFSQYARDLFEKLLEKDHGIAHAIQTGIQCLQSDNWWVGDQAVCLFEKLFAKGHGFTQAEETIQRIRETENENANQNANDLEEALKKAREQQRELHNN